MSPGPMAVAFAADIRCALRRLARSPVFATLAIGTLAIGIGVNTAMVAVMDALLFRPPFHIGEPEGVVRVQFRVEDGSEQALVEATHYPTFRDVKASGAFAGIAAYTDASVSIGNGGDASLAGALLVSSEFFDVLRLKPRLGSVSLGVSAMPDGGDKVVISYGFWQRHFGGTLSAVGTDLRIDGRVYSVGGVAPQGFQSLSARPVDVWLPLDHASSTGAAPREWRENRGPFWLSVVGRVRDRSSASAAAEQASALLRNRRATGDETNVTSIATSSVVPGRGTDKPLEVQVGLWLTGVSALVLLLACASVANVVLARMFAQRREYSILLTLGASRRHLVRRVVADVCLVVLPGAAGALGMSFLFRNAISVFLSGEIPLSRSAWDVRTAGIMMGSTAVVFGVLSAISLVRLRSTTTERALLVRATDKRNLGTGSRQILLGLQSSLCLALLFVAGLFARSLHRVQALDLGLDLERTIQLTVHLGTPTREQSEVRGILERARDALARDPNVERVSLADGSPYMSGTGVGPWTAQRSPRELWANREAAYRSTVGAGFFATVGARSLHGRDFSIRDGAGTQRVAIVNVPLAQHLWPAADPIGQCMWLDEGRACYQIVGVLGGVWKFSALERKRMAMYLPLAQTPEARPSALFVRPRGDAREFLARARSIVQRVNPALPAVEAVLLRDIVDPEFRPWRLGATVFSAFTGIALLIASIGLYGVVAVTTTLRLNEIGIRMSLGARWPHLMRIVVGEGIVAVAGGLLVGGVLVFAASSWLGGVLFETSSRDPVVLLQTAGILLLVSAVAVSVPTIRALRTNPSRVLLAELASVDAP